MLFLMTLSLVWYRFNFGCSGYTLEYYGCALRVFTNRLLELPLISLITNIIASEALLLSIFLQTNFVIVGFRITVKNIIHKRLLSKGVIFRFVILTVLSPTCSTLSDSF